MRRIKNAKISFISLCPKGANRLPVIYKADNHVEFRTLTKALENFDEKGELTAVVYAPEFRDSQGDIAAPEVVRKMCHDFQRDGGQVDLKHENVAVSKDRACVVENFIVQKGDPRFDGLTDYAGKPVDATGSWGVVIKVDDPELRKLYRAGKWNGVSMGGVAELEPEISKSIDEVLDEFAKRLKGKESDMDRAEVQKLIDESLAKHATATTTAVEAAIAKALAPKTPETKPPEKSAEKPILKIDPTNRDEVKKHLAALERERLEKSVDWTNPDEVKKHLAALEKSGEEPPAETDEETKSLEERVAKAEKDAAEAKARLAKLAKASGVPPAPGAKPSTLAKADQDALGFGAEIAKAANESRFPSKK